MEEEETKTTQQVHNKMRNDLPLTISESEIKTHLLTFGIDPQEFSQYLKDRKEQLKFKERLYKEIDRLPYFSREKI